MRLSVVFELLLVFLFLAFAAARVIDPQSTTKNVAKKQKKATTVRQGPPNRYCACTSRMCNCCRDFSLPVVPIKGPGCASIMYVQRDTMMVTMSFGDRVLSNTTISGKTPKPICMALPGGISQFCGRIYGISRKGDQFRACLGLELRALDDIEAALRVSCFKFGPKGVKLESAPPVPVESGGKDPEEDDDDYDDLDDDDDDLIGFEDDEDDGASNEDNEVDSDSVDYTGFSVLGEDILGSFFSDDSGSGSSKKKKATKKTVKPQVIVPKVSSTTRRPVFPNIRRSTIKPDKVTMKPVINRVTKKPRPSASRPQLIQRPSASLPTVVVPQISVQAPSSQVLSKPSSDKYVVVQKPATTAQTPFITTQAMETNNWQEKQQTSTEVIYTATEPAKLSFTFTIPTENSDVTRNDVVIPQMDLEKVEAVAAIAQQDVTSGVIASSALTSEETKKPQKIGTEIYEASTTPVMPDTEITYIPVTEKIDSVKFVPTTVVTSSPSFEIQSVDNRLDEIVNEEIASNPSSEITSIKNKITSFYQESTQTTFDEKEHSEGESANDEEEPEEEEKKDTLESNNIQTLVHKKDNFTIISIKKQPLQTESFKNEDEDEDEDELIDEVLGVDDNEDLEDEEEEEISQELGQALKKKKPIHSGEVSDEEEEEEENDEDSGASEKIEVANKKVKPSKNSNKKKPTNSKIENEEDEEDDDILSVLGDDDDDEDDDDSDDDEEDSEDDDNAVQNTNKNKVTPTQSTTPQIKNLTVTKRPLTQPISQTVLTNKPVTQPTEQNTSSKRPIAHQVSQVLITKKPIIQQTEKIVMTKRPVPQQISQTVLTSYPMTQHVEQTMLIGKPAETTEKEPQLDVTEKVFIYKPEEHITEKIFIYQEPIKASPEQIFVYKEPENKVTSETTEKIIMHQQPVHTITEKYIIYQQPSSKPVGKPVQILYDNDSKDEESNDETVHDEENSSEEEFDEDSDEENHTLMASIIKNRPVFNHKHSDSTDNKDLDIEDSDDEGNDFEEDRKLKEKMKTLDASSVASVKPAENVKNSKIFTLSDLINQRKKFEIENKDKRPMNSSRTHRRMNLDKLLQV